MDQLSLFDQIATIQARDEAINRVDEHADPIWKRAALMAIRSIAVDQDELTTDDVWQWLYDMAIEAPHEPRALGAMMIQASREGLISATDRVRKSLRPVCHANPKRVWMSNVRSVHA
jgi:hypothetical protein